MAKWGQGGVRGIYGVKWGQGRLRGVKGVKWGQGRNQKVSLANKVSFWPQSRTNQVKGGAKFSRSLQKDRGTNGLKDGQTYSVWSFKE